MNSFRLFLWEHPLPFLLILLLLNLFVFLLYAIDKHRAQTQQWRIPETTLILSAWLGGSLGALLGMRCFRHKTRHLSFRVLIPLALLVHAALLFLLLFPFPTR